MSNMFPIKDRKVQFYSDKEVVEQYDKKRFGTKEGQWVNSREIEACVNHLPSGLNAVIDAPVGTGRLSAALLNKNLSVIGLDSSESMIEIARAKLKDVDLVLGDIFHMPFPSNTFDASFCVRFTFHTDLLLDLFREEMRIIRPGGYFVFDTIRWSPKTMIPKGSGSRLYSYSDDQVQKYLRKVGAEVARKEAMFILPTYAYSILPYSVVRLMKELERVWPQSALSRVFWLAKKL